MRGTLEVGLKAYLHPRHQHCTDEAQKTETVPSAVSYISIYRFSVTLSFASVRSSDRTFRSTYVYLALLPQH